MSIVANITKKFAHVGVAAAVAGTGMMAEPSDSFAGDFNAKVKQAMGIKECTLRVRGNTIRLTGKLFGGCCASGNLQATTTNFNEVPPSLRDRLNPNAKTLYLVTNNAGCWGGGSNNSSTTTPNRGNPGDTGVGGGCRNNCGGGGGGGGNSPKTGGSQGGGNGGNTAPGPKNSSLDAYDPFAHLAETSFVFLPRFDA